MEASFYPYLGALCWIGMLLMLGTLIRAKVPLFQKLLFPSSLIGGLIGFVLINLAAGGLLGLEQTDAHEAEREQVEGDHTENVRRNVLPAGGGGHPDQIKVDQHEPDEATYKGGRKQQLLEQRHLGTD